MSRRSISVAVTTAAVLFAATVAGTTSTSAASPRAGAGSSSETSYVVLADQGVSAEKVAARLRAAGATVTSVNTAIGMVSVKSTDAGFRAGTARIAGVSGVAANRSIGYAPTRPQKVERENLLGKTKPAKSKPAKPAKPPKAAKSDPLDTNLWGMRMIGADKAHAITLGSKRVRVGIMDTGVQGDHPDLHPNFDYGRSRNFTTDIPAIDGPCENASCVDPVGEDDNGHGTHVAGTIGAAMNNFGVSGVSPKVDIVEVRAGQDSGFFFLQPTVDALTYSADAGLDVVNMSFYVDPWLYNCAGGAPEDSPAQAADQGVIIEAMNRALNYANDHDVTLVAATGNEHDNLAGPRHDFTSPDYGADPFERTIDNATCVNLPVEGPNVIGVDALGPSGKKSDFSNYTSAPTSGEVELSAPGGWFRDGFGTPTYRTNENLILSSVPLVALQDTGEVDENGDITPGGEATGVKKVCQSDPEPGTTACGYYAFFQGTSMASPHVAGVVALAVAAHGSKLSPGNFGMAPSAVRSLLLGTATDHACPPGGVQSYTNEGRSAEFTATCVGTTALNGFYGEGIVNALGVVQ